MYFLWYFNKKCLITVMHKCYCDEVQVLMAVNRILIDQFNVVAYLIYY